MILLANFSVRGYEPCPWSVPISNRNGGSYRPKKSRPGAGILNLEDWQSAVRDAAEGAMAGLEPTDKPVFLVLRFFSQSRTEADIGALWSPGVRYSPKANKGSGGWVRSRTGRKAEPDLTNLVKGTEDAMQGVVFHDDIQVRGMLLPPMRYALTPGLDAYVYFLEDADIDM